MNQVLKKNILRQAEARALQSGQKWTQTRADVFCTMVETEKPLSAYRLIEELKTRKNRAMKPLSVYRCLELFRRIGIVGRIESLNAYIVYKSPGSNAQYAFFICDSCGHVDEINDKDLHLELQNKARTLGFHASSCIQELRGTCKTCQNTAGSEACMGNKL